MGDSGVGKTTIIGRYIDKFSDREKSTVGASFTNKIDTINDQQILFELWDTAGQERFRSLNNIFYQDASICIMVYDITNRKTFESLKDYWYNSVKENGNEGIIFHIAGNKIDLFENELVKKNEIKEYCKSIGAEYSFISALENNFIDDLFKKVGEKFLNSKIYDKKDGKNKNPEKFSLDKDNESDNNENNQKNEKKKKCC